MIRSAAVERGILDTSRARELHHARYQPPENVLPGSIAYPKWAIVPGFFGTPQITGEF